MLSLAYQFLTEAGAPLIRLFLNRRLAKGREDPLRFQERLGNPSRPRPHGPLIWCHGASVGEAMSALTLLSKIQEAHPGFSYLLTTGTVTSAKLLETRMPQGMIHQYVPVDRMPYVERFLNHWQPNLILWVESDLWPNLMKGISKRSIPAILINGHMSEKSYRHWLWAKDWIGDMLKNFSLCLVQTEVEKARFENLGAQNVRAIGNLKYAASPLPCDRADYKKWRDLLDDRPFWLMASTHKGEDELALAVHAHAKKQFPNLLTMIAPRHPSRARDVRNMAEAAGLKVAQRSMGDPVTEDCDLYLIDTMGEMGLFYRLASVVCVGGSFTWGGHNPIEPAHLNCAIVFGPNMTNFAEIASEMLAAHAVEQVHDIAKLPFVITSLLSVPPRAEALMTAAKNFAAAKANVTHDLLKTLNPLLELTRR